MSIAALISCVSQKVTYKTEARNMYISSLFTKGLKYIENIFKPDKIYILSAKYGLLKLDEVIEPYNETLNTKNKAERKKWAEKVLLQIKNECNISNDTFIFIAGKKYYQDLIHFLPNNKIIMENKPIGKRLQ
jgi:cytoplasmic iron level regulating protein YaaA (DUF328/UPF0246 family)